MKKIVFIIFLLNFLLVGVNKVYANSSKEKISFTNKENNSKENLIKITIANSTVLLFDEVTIDFDEELHDNNSNKNNFPVSKSNFLQNWYISNSKLFKLNFSNNNFEIFSHFSGYSNPIYISIQVLRI